MLSKKRKKKVVFGKIFNPSFQKGDFVEYPNGKVIWSIEYITKYDLRISSLGSDFTDRYVSARNPYPFYRVTREEAIRFISQHYPINLSNHFQNEELRDFFKKYLKEV